MSIPTFYTPINRATTTLSTPHVSGDGRLVVTSATAFGSPSSASPIRVSVTISGIDSHFAITGITGNTMTIGGMLEGTSDVNIPAGTTVEIRITAKDIKDLQDSVVSISTDYVQRSTTLTATRVPFADAAGKLTDAAGLTWSTNTLTISGNVLIPASATSAIVYADSTGKLSALTVGSGLSLAGGTLSVSTTGLSMGSSISGGTAGRVLVEGTGPVLADDPLLTWGSGVLTVTGQIKLGGATSGATALVAVAAASGTLTLPSTTDTLVGRATTDTLTNKTLTLPIVTSQSAPAASLGQLYVDSTRKSVGVGVGTTATNINLVGVPTVNLTAVTANTASSTTAQNLMSYTVPGSLLNAVGKTIKLFAAGLVTINNTATVAIAVKLGSVTLLTWTSASITATQANCPWNIDMVLSTVSTGTTGTVEPHGVWNLKPTAGAGAATSYIDGNTAASATLDLTVSQTLQVTVTFSANGATANSCTQRTMHVELSY